MEKIRTTKALSEESQKSLEEMQRSWIKVRFKNLSGWLKTAIIFAWIVGGIYVLYFLYGLFIGIGIGWGY